MKKTFLIFALFIVGCTGVTNKPTIAAIPTPLDSAIDRTQRKFDTLSVTTGKTVEVANLCVQVLDAQRQLIELQDAEIEIICNIANKNYTTNDEYILMVDRSNAAHKRCNLKKREINVLTHNEKLNH